MQYTFVLDAVHLGLNGIGVPRFWAEPFHISGDLFRRASRRNCRASSPAKKPRFRCAENEHNERDYGQSRIQDDHRAGCDHGEQKRNPRHDPPAKVLPERELSPTRVP
jgi:hypothetical protein